MQEMPETRVQSLGWEDPLEEGMAIHFSIPAWKIPWTEEPGSMQSTGSHRIGHDYSKLAHTHYSTNLLLGIYSTEILAHGSKVKCTKIHTATFWGGTPKLVGSKFPDQGLNLGHGGENTKS